MEPFREPNALQIRVTLAEIEPAIWRRLVAPWTWHLGQLHPVIQAAFNWWNSHLREFRIRGLRYGDPEADDDWSTRPARAPSTSTRYSSSTSDASLDSPSPISTTSATTGHTVEIEKLLAFDIAPRSGACIDGARAGPPEDVGGVAGLRALPRHHGRSR